MVIINSYAALGDGGNVIYVNPAKNLVSAIASLFIPRPRDRIAFIKGYLAAYGYGVGKISMKEQTVLFKKSD